MAKRLDAFTVTAKLKILADWSDFISFKGEFIDGEMEIGNIARDPYWDLES